MVAGVADFRRRYFSARLLNTLLKEGCIGKETLHSEVVKAELYTRVKTLKDAFIGQEDFRPRDVEAEMFARALKREHERKKSEYHTGVAVDYGHASSIIGWWAMRVLVLDFGLVFSKRVKVTSLHPCVLTVDTVCCYSWIISRSVVTEVGIMLYHVRTCYRVLSDSYG